jgi:hypothetical protein
MYGVVLLGKGTNKEIPNRVVMRSGIFSALLFVVFYKNHFAFIAVIG